MNYILLLISVYCSGYYYSTTTQGSYLAVGLLIIGVALFIFVSLIEGKGIKIEKAILLYWVYFLTTTVIVEVINNGFSLSSLRIILVYTFAMLIVSRISLKAFLKVFEICMIVISVFAILEYVLWIRGSLNAFPVVTNYNNEVFINGIFFSALKYPYVGVSSRVQGIFWEPGLYASFLILAIIFSQSETRNMYYYAKIIFFSVCVVLSKSGAGILLLPLAIVIKILEAKGNGLTKTAKIIVLIIMGGVLISSISGADQYLNTYLFNKIGAPDTNSGARINSIIRDLQLLLYKPWGCGISQYASTVSSVFGAGLSNTSTLTIILAQYGLFGVPIVVVWIKSIIRMGSGKNFLYAIGIVIAMIIILTEEPHGSLIFMNCIIIYYICEPNLSFTRIDSREVNNE